MNADMKKVDNGNKIVCYLSSVPGRKVVFDVRLIFRKIQESLRIGIKLGVAEDKYIYVRCSGIPCNQCPLRYYIAETLDSIEAKGYASNSGYTRFTCGDYILHVLNSSSIRKILLYMGMIDAAI